MHPSRAATTEIASLLDPIRDRRALSARMDHLSLALQGRPYLADSLVGSPTTREVLVTRLDGFDCVTFVESVLALALSHRPADFAPLLRSIRYLGGRLRWRDRNHYFSQWVARNGRAGFVSEQVPREVTRGPKRRLDVVAGLPAKTWWPRYLPLPARLDGLVNTGDIVAFVSTRSDLDVFHTGLLVAGHEVLLRHAARSAATVSEEPLSAFLSRNTTPGLLLVRPLVPPNLDSAVGGVA